MALNVTFRRPQRKEKTFEKRKVLSRLFILFFKSQWDRGGVFDTLSGPSKRERLPLSFSSFWNILLLSLDPPATLFSSPFFSSILLGWFPLFFFYFYQWQTRRYNTVQQLVNVRGWCGETVANTRDLKKLLVAALSLSFLFLCVVYLCCVYCPTTASLRTCDRGWNRVSTATE